MLHISRGAQEHSEVTLHIDMMLQDELATCVYYTNLTQLSNFIGRLLYQVRNIKYFRTQQFNLIKRESIKITIKKYQKNYKMYQKNYKKASKELKKCIKELQKSIKRTKKMYQKNYKKVSKEL